MKIGKCKRCHAELEASLECSNCGESDPLYIDFMRSINTQQRIDQSDEPSLIFMSFMISMSIAISTTVLLGGLISFGVNGELRLLSLNDNIILFILLFIISYITTLIVLRKKDFDFRCKVSSAVYDMKNSAVEIVRENSNKIDEIHAGTSRRLEEWFETIDYEGMFRNNDPHGRFAKYYAGSVLLTKGAIRGKPSALDFVFDGDIAVNSIDDIIRSLAPFFTKLKIERFHGLVSIRYSLPYETRKSLTEKLAERWASDLQKLEQ